LIWMPGQARHDGFSESFAYAKSSARTAQPPWISHRTRSDSYIEPSAPANIRPRRLYKIPDNRWVVSGMTS
jgi:hypothetical protein